MIYWDASAVVPLIVPQQHSEVLRNMYLTTDENAAVWLTQVEVMSALCRLARENSATDSEWSELESGFTNTFRTIRIGFPSKELAQITFTILRQHALRAGDAVQLGGFLLARKSIPNLQFACLDQRLRVAAATEITDESGHFLVP